MRRRKKTRLLTAALAALVPLALAVVCPATTPEDELKSAAVLSFLRYSEWPSSSRGSITVGVFGRSGFADALSHTLDGKLINNRPVRLVPVDLTTDLRGFDLVYIASGKTGDVRQILAGAANARALAVGEADRFLDYGGAIHLYLIDGHIGFEVNLEAIERSGVTISSSMLRLGQIHDPRRGRPSQ